MSFSPTHLSRVVTCSPSSSFASHCASSSSRSLRTKAIFFSSSTHASLKLTRNCTHQTIHNSRLPQPASRPASAFATSSSGQKHMLGIHASPRTDHLSVSAPACVINDHRGYIPAARRGNQVTTQQRVTQPDSSMDAPGQTRRVCTKSPVTAADAVATRILGGRETRRGPGCEDDDRRGWCQRRARGCKQARDRRPVPMSLCSAQFAPSRATLLHRQPTLPSPAHGNLPADLTLARGRYGLSRTTLGMYAPHWENPAVCVLGNTTVTVTEVGSGEMSKE